jgi:hypothetical protein
VGNGGTTFLDVCMHWQLMATFPDTLGGSVPSWYLFMTSRPACPPSHPPVGLDQLQGFDP